MRKIDPQQMELLKSLGLENKGLDAWDADVVEFANFQRKRWELPADFEARCIWYARILGGLLSKDFMQHMEKFVLEVGKRKVTNEKPADPDQDIPGPKHP